MSPGSSTFFEKSAASDAHPLSIATNLIITASQIEFIMEQIVSQEFYTKEFTCGNSVISRQELESLPCPFYTAEVTDEQMQTIIDNTDLATKYAYKLPLDQPIDFNNDRYTERWWSELENAVLQQNVPYYEDMDF